METLNPKPWTPRIRDASVLHLFGTPALDAHSVTPAAWQLMHRLRVNPLQAPNPKSSTHKLRVNPLQTLYPKPANCLSIPC
jgi:hypothetical protein